MHRLIPLILTALVSCATPSRWSIDTISAGDPLFDSTRLSYRSENPDTPLYLELIRTDGEIFGSLNLRQFSFHPISQKRKGVEATFRLGDSTIVAELPLLEGNMKARLPSSLTDALLAALQENTQVHVSVDGFQETFLPDHFSDAFTAWSHSSSRLSGKLRGPVE